MPAEKPQFDQLETFQAFDLTLIRVIAEIIEVYPDAEVDRDDLLQVGRVRAWEKISTAVDAPSRTDLALLRSHIKRSLTDLFLKTGDLTLPLGKQKAYLRLKARADQLNISLDPSQIVRYLTLIESVESVLGIQLSQDQQEEVIEFFSVTLRGEPKGGRLWFDFHKKELTTILGLNKELHFEQYIQITRGWRKAIRSFKQVVANNENISWEEPGDLVNKESEAELDTDVDPDLAKQADQWARLWIASRGFVGDFETALYDYLDDAMQDIYRLLNTMAFHMATSKEISLGSDVILGCISEHWNRKNWKTWKTLTS
jgi:hypothetical protein